MRRRSRCRGEEKGKVKGRTAQGAAQRKKQQQHLQTFKSADQPVTTETSHSLSPLPAEVQQGLLSHLLRCRWLWLQLRQRAAVVLFSSGPT